MHIADSRNHADIRIDHAGHFANFTAVLRAHFRDKHLMIGLQLFVDHAGYAHRRRKAGRRRQHAVFFGKNAFENHLDLRFAIAARDRDFANIGMRRQLLSRGAVKARVDSIFDGAHDQRRQQHGIFRRGEHQIGRYGNQRKQQHRRKIDQPDHDYQTQNAPRPRKRLRLFDLPPAQKYHGGSARERRQHDPAAHRFALLLLRKQHGHRHRQIPVDQCRQHPDQNIRREQPAAALAHLAAQGGNLIPVRLQGMNRGHSRQRDAERKYNGSDNYKKHIPSNPTGYPRPFIQSFIPSHPHPRKRLLPRIAAWDRFPDALRACVPAP